MDLNLTQFKARRNLLAFSGGLDSSALFFLLHRAGVSFDIAIVDYGMRLQSTEEVAYAKSLAKTYGKDCFSTKAPAFHSNFEARARTFRYEFFEDIIAKKGYDTLITAHHFDDMFEWFLMQLSKGAGLDEALGLEPLVQQNGYTLARPLLGVSRSELSDYVNNADITYFEDATNNDTAYKRNAFRHRYAAPLSRAYEAGLKRSLRYLMEDKQSLLQGIERQFAKNQLRIYRCLPHNKQQAAVKALKELGYLPSASQRAEIAKHDSLVLGGRFALGFKDDLLFCSPYRQEVMPKSFKERCRELRIPRHNRGYIYSSRLDLSTLEKRIASSSR